MDKQDLEKIAVMTKLAVYEKKYGEKDRKISDYFRYDYIYWSNFQARLCAFIGCLIILGLYFAKLVFLEEMDIFVIDYYNEGIKAAKFIIFVLAAVTLFNSIGAAKKYTEAQKRIKTQLSLIKRLDKINLRQSSLSEGEALVYYGTNTYNTRSSNKEF